MQEVAHLRHPPSVHSQHAFHHALTTRLALDVFHGDSDAGSTVAAKAGADAPGGCISLCIRRRGCVAPAQKSPRSTPRHPWDNPTLQHEQPACSISVAAAGGDGLSRRRDKPKLQAVEATPVPVRGFSRHIGWVLGDVLGCVNGFAWCWVLFILPCGKPALV